MRWRLSLLFFFALGAALARAEDGYRLWLRYDRIADEPLRVRFSAATQRIVFSTPAGTDSATLAVARAELLSALTGLLGAAPKITLAHTPPLDRLGPEGYALRADSSGTVRITANRDLGILYGAFALIRELQLRHPLERLNLTSDPRITRRLLNHWDDLNRFVERGYAGQSLWEWFNLPDIRSPRYHDYARACASLGLNGTVLNNVNANALVLTAPYLKKVAALADEFRPYGLRVYLTARFSAPVEIGGLKTADPLDAEVIAWWHDKVDEIYRLIPDFGGFLVKANSEGQPGPQNYGRTHADGANLFADALAPHHGIVLWRAFVYETQPGVDRVKQAFNEFVPLDGQFHDNVVLQIKNGPLDFMPREPFHPLFGAMPRTPLALEVQITQEYLGQATQLAHLGPLWKETLDADTFTSGPGTTVARVIDGSVSGHKLTVISGVANTGTDRNWTGHPLAQANWYVFGRLAWDHTLPADALADEWTRLTFSGDPKVVTTIDHLLRSSRETVVNYSMPLGLHHIMAAGHHYGPGPWYDQGRADWTPPYYHHADAFGLGVNRTATGSNALAQYSPIVARVWADPATCPENVLLWFHHVAWKYRLSSDQTLWEELCLHYQQGVDEIRALQRDWDGLATKIDAERFTDVQARLRRQEADARDWRDACLLYFQTFSKLPLPVGVEPPAHDLDYYKAQQLHYLPGNPGER